MLVFQGTHSCAPDFKFEEVGESLPYTARKGVQLVKAWKEVLYQYSAQGNQAAHVLRFPRIEHLR